MMKIGTVRNLELSPSLICMDLCNLESEMKRLESLGCEVLHVDVLDGYFSPSMPIGLGTIRQLRKKTGMVFDAHIMAVDSSFFVDELLEIGCERICFQIEMERSPGPLLQRIRAAGRLAGLALSPGTPISALEYLIEDCDRVLLMRINPGYAHLPGQPVKPYMDRKLDEIRQLITRRGVDVAIAMDGHLGLDEIRPLYAGGASTFVCGTGCLFQDGLDLERNWVRLLELLPDKASEGQ